MPSFDQYGNFRGTFYGVDRQGHTTPSPDASQPLQPYMPVPYPAPWLPTKRRDHGHPVDAGKVLSEGQAIGLDKSGAFIPAGLFCGDTGTKANGGDYCVIVYSDMDVAIARNAATGNKV